MKWVLSILGIAAAGAAGYLFEPQLRPILTGHGADKGVAQVSGELVSVEKAVVSEVDSEPVVAEAEPVAAEPEPVVVEPEPITVEPEPAVLDPEPVAVEPEPLAVEPEPLAIEPEPTAVEPEPVVVEPEPITTEIPAADDPVVGVMQTSIREKEVKEFTFEQVIGWKAEGIEEVDGETYQTGLAAYKAETILGAKIMYAKALILDGRVVKWVWEGSGKEIK